MEIKVKWGSSFFRQALSIVLLVSMTISCSNTGGNNGDELDETEISIIVGKTLAAEEQMTAQALETTSLSQISTPVSEANSIQSTINAQQATLDAQATLINQPRLTATASLAASASPPDTVTPEALVSLEPIVLQDWRPVNMVQAPGCGEDKDGPPCWFGSKAEMSITSRKPILIDPAWPSPHLVFDHRYVFVHDATIYVKIKGGWEILWSFPSGQSAPWVPFNVDLSKFKGEEIELQMSSTGTVTSPGGKMKVSSWDIRDPKIVPDFSPY